MKNEKTHIVFDGKNIVISPNLREIFLFLKGIEQEVETLLSFERKLKKIAKQVSEIGGVMATMVKNLPKDFKMKISENPKTLAEKFKFQRPTRCEFVALFAYLETLRCLHTAYGENTTDDKKLRDASGSSIDDFLKKFCLCPENEWVKSNSRRSGKIGASHLRKLRNSITHFFSTPPLFVITSVLNDDHLKVEKDLNFKAHVFSSDDLYKIIQGAAHLLLKMWNTDCQRSIKENNLDFKQRINCVNDIVKKNGVISSRREEEN